VTIRAFLFRVRRQTIASTRAAARVKLVRNVLCYVSFPDTSLPSCGQPGSSKSSATRHSQEREVSMFSSFAIAATIGFVIGIVIVVGLAVRARADDNIARVLYDVEHPEKTR
jgi:hypothetical protein